SHSMSTHFQQKKLNILTRLALDTPDASPKGYVDEEIRPLVDQLNKHNGIVTTSSCAGRIAVFLEGVKKELAANAEPTSLERERLPDGLRGNLDYSSVNIDIGLEDGAPKRAGIGGKGPGGQWIFVSHAPVQNGLLTWQKLNGDTINGYLSCNEGKGSIAHTSPHTNTHVIGEESRLLHFKFEPMILHIMTNTLELAHHILKIALSCGYRESGIMNPTLPATLAIRTAGLSFDCIIGHYDTSSGKVCQTVDDSYLEMLVSVANSRFRENENRRDSFSNAVHLLLEETVNSNLVSNPKWEDSEIRKKRMKLEGLQRKSKL
ncbi:tRNA wybutosine-synthesizing protein, partial [Terfezia claveryi]